LTHTAVRAIIGVVRVAVPVVLVVVALVLAAQASASVHAVKFTSRVAPGDDASLTVKVTPTARCTITVTYNTGKSHARGLRPKRGGTITWTWRVGTRTKPGRWPVVVDCATSGKLRRTLVVTR
jgi:micrococcal nuclease